jgi:branched-chain amino acid transport system substrate-binding protein
MESDAKKRCIEVLLKEKYEAGAPDFKPMLSKVKSLAPDVVYMVSYVMDASLLMKQIKELRLDAKLFAGGAAGFAIPEFIDNARDAAEYVVSATLWTPQVKYRGAREFAEKYRARHGDLPSYHGAAAYSALFVLKAAMTAARDWSPEGIRDGLRGVSLETAFGPVKFENREGYQNQNFVEPLAIQVQGGAFETIWPKEHASKPSIYPVPAWRDRR